jgi:DNA-binding MarR family transcriptional regulator
LDDAEVERLLGGTPRVTHRDIVGHPRLADARRHYVDRFLAVYDGDPFLVRLLIESGRLSLYVLALVIEAAQDPLRRETWLTIGALKNWLAMTGTASDRHVDHLVARLCAAGFMTARAPESDRRVRILSLTDKARAHDRAWLAAHYAPLSVLYPEHDYRPVLAPSAEFQVLHRRTAMTYATLGMRLMFSEPDMLLFLNHAAGYPILAALLQAAMRADDTHAAVRYSDVGDRFGVSGAQVRKLLVAAEERGLVKLHARGGRRVEIMPKLWASHDRGICGGMYFHDVVFTAAMQARELRGATS